MTIYIRLLAEHFAKNNKVCVVTSRYNDSLLEREIINNVSVFRTKIFCRISKGVISPTFISKSIKLARSADIVNVHLPMFEAGFIAATIESQKLIVTYHCDINLEGYFLKNVIEKIMFFSMGKLLHKAKKIVVNNIDYARDSGFLSRFIDKCIEINPPFFSTIKTQEKYKSGIENYKIVGFLGRFVKEKGIEYLIKAIPYILEKKPNIYFLLGGEYKNIAGGGNIKEIMRLTEKYKENIKILGRIPYEELGKFYSSLDVLVLPSINSFESFGMVQVEAMLCGTPVVASNLRGVRQIILKTGMGELAEAKNEKDLADKILKVIENKEYYYKPREEILKIYNNSDIFKRYAAIFGIK